MSLYGLVGVVLVVLGVILGWRQYIITQALFVIQTHIALVDNTALYTIWSSPILLTFSCYLFNVTNPDEVMRGAEPNISEVGPLTFDELFEKVVVDVDNENDEITYFTKSTYTFNRHQSLNISIRDKVTILNPAYVGVISTLTNLPLEFMQKYGNNIPKLFPNRNSIFLKARPIDLLFNGVKIACNSDKFPELNLICKTLKGNPPPVLRPSDKEGVYFFSFFQRVNGSLRGPFTINRGLKNITQLADTTAYMGQRIQTFWHSESCNRVRGTDTITWAPLVKPLPYVSTFIPDMCRSVEADYDRDISIHGLTGSRFSLQERVWLLNESQCYCPIVNQKTECLPQGLQDTSECQQAPLIMSEPHFLHADPSLLSYAHGLKPNEKLHSTYIVIEPITGAPLSGNKKVQLNMKLTRQPVDLLSNVSEGIFPLLWCANGNTPALNLLGWTYQVIRLLHLLSFLQLVPLIVGIYMILLTLLLRGCVKHKVQPSVFVTQPISVMSHSQASIASEAQRQPLHTFERFQRVYTTL